MTSEPPLLPTASAARQRSVLTKMGAIALLIALLYVPLTLLHGVLHERLEYQAQAASEIASLWGNEQHITGPILEIPYVYTNGTVQKAKMMNNQWTHVEAPVLVSARAYFLPGELHIESTVDPEIRRRGIYETVVYTTRLKFTGAWQPSFAAAGIEADEIAWDKARVLFGISDLHGLRSITPLHDSDGKDAPFESIEGSADTCFPLAARIGTVTSVSKTDFTFEVIVQGSGAMMTAPLGKTTTAALRSSWKDPSFVGAWLPIQHHVSDAGFDAQWSVANFSRGFPQNWTSRLTSFSDVAKKIDCATFGVRFARGVEGYSVVERAQKYGVLFFVLVFAVYFLFEVTAELRIHPLQYAMVGAALCLFFLGFLALTEFWTTGFAYLASAAACTGMVSLYSWSFLHTGSRTGVVFGGLGATYGYLYFVLKSQDYALIAGTLALFAALALAMFFTRRINWYTVEPVTT